MSAKHLAQGLAHYQGLSEHWQLSGSDALPAAACGDPPACWGSVWALRADDGWVPGLVAPAGLPEGSLLPGAGRTACPIAGPLCTL